MLPGVLVGVKRKTETRYSTHPPPFAKDDGGQKAAVALRGEEELSCRAALRRPSPLSYKDPGVRRIFQSM